MMNELTGWRFILNTGYKKFRLANLFNHIGCRLGRYHFILSSLFALFFIKMAIYLNPYHADFRVNREYVIRSIIDIFRKKLPARHEEVIEEQTEVDIVPNMEKTTMPEMSILEIPDRVVTTPETPTLEIPDTAILAAPSSENLPETKEEKPMFPLLGVKEWCKQQHVLFCELGHPRIINVTRPHIINPERMEVAELYEGPIKLPNSYFSELDKVTVFGGTDLIFDHNNKQIIYDELAYTEPDYYYTKSGMITKRKENKAAINYPDSQKAITLSRAIHFMKDHSMNYFHWLIECLPRSLIINQFSHLNHVPLLVDTDLSPQHYEALDLVNETNRPLIKLPANQPCLVEKLYFPSSLSIIQSNHHNAVRSNIDILYSPVAINYMRNFILKKILGDRKITPWRKIYLSRRDSYYRKILNVDAVENLMQHLGYEIVHPGNLGFKNQVETFAEAKCIVGQSGAGMANLLFAPAECKAIVLLDGDKQTNYNVLHFWTSFIGIEIRNLLGKGSQCSDYGTSMHNDFWVDIDLLKSTVQCL